MELILEQLIFFFSILLLLFAPGYFLFLAVFGKEAPFNQLEKSTVFFGASFLVVTFLLLFLGKIGLQINRFSTIVSVLTACLLLYALYRLRMRFGHFKKDSISEKIVFGKKQTLAIAILVFLTIFIKTVYLQNAIFPTSTDLGHHMYWSKLTVETGQIPVYQKSEISQSPDGKYSIGSPEPIADFIIGEHLIFSAISLVSGIGLVSYLPSSILFLINIFSVLSIFILSAEIFKRLPFGNNVAISALLFIGPLYAISSPQAKFVSGGVVGNIFGNFLMPLIIYFAIKALKEKSSLQMAMAILFGLALAYTHHLSTFILVFSVAFSAVFILFSFRKDILDISRTMIKTLFSPACATVLVFSFVMLFFIYTPTYLNFSAVDTAVGTPSKSTRTGLTFQQLTSSSGHARMIMGILGLIAVLLIHRARDFGKSFLLGWTFAILIMSLWPSLLFVDIPSNRIANYLIPPLSILAGFFMVGIFEISKATSPKKSALGVFSMKPLGATTILTLLLVMSITNGLSDNSSSLSDGSNIEKAVQTFESSKYLAEKIGPDDVILKDHNYMTADAWMKLFFYKDYNFPFSRAYFKRYEDETKPRERCTLNMISLPNSEEAKKCFSGTGTNFIVVNPAYDGSQFRKIKNFWQVYQSDAVLILHKKN